MPLRLRVGCADVKVHPRPHTRAHQNTHTDARAHTHAREHAHALTIADVLNAAPSSTRTLRCFVISFARHGLLAQC